MQKQLNNIAVFGVADKRKKSVYLDNQMQILLCYALMERGARV